MRWIYAALFGFILVSHVTVAQSPRVIDSAFGIAWGAKETAVAKKFEKRFGTEYNAQESRHSRGSYYGGGHFAGYDAVEFQLFFEDGFVGGEVYYSDQWQWESIGTIDKRFELFRQSLVEKYGIDSYDYLGTADSVSFDDRADTSETRISANLSWWNHSSNGDVIRIQLLIMNELYLVLRYTNVSMLSRIKQRNKIRVNEEL